VRSNGYLACTAVAYSVVINAILNVAVDSLYGTLLAAFLAFGFILLFHLFSLFRKLFACIYILCISKIFIRKKEKQIMAIFTIADLHLSTLDTTNKSMEVFGKRWTDYTSRLEKNWRRLVSENDTVIIPGDISWALSLNEAACDLKFIDSLPGKKILGKGNHDFWWCTMKKHTEFFKKNDIKSISFLFNNAHECENYIIAGTRGWFHDENATGVPDNTDFIKLTKREQMRLRMSLTAAEKLRQQTEKPIIVFTHFPPFWNGKASENMIDELKAFGIKKVYFGHIHSTYTIPRTFEYEGISMSLVSADFLEFTPSLVSFP